MGGLKDPNRFISHNLDQTAV